MVRTLHDRVPMNKLTKVFSVGVILGSALLGGCSASADAGDDAPARGEAEPLDPTSAFSSEGLVLQRRTADSVEGTFEHDGAAVRFRFARRGDAREAVLQTREGAPLVESKYENGVDTSVYFGGKAKAVGVVDEEPRMEGEPSTFEEVARSDARIAPRLKEALIAAKVDRAIFAPDRAAPSGGIRPQSYYYNGWNFLDGYGDSYTFWSWSFWGTTTVVMANGGTNLSFSAIDWNAVNTGRVDAYIQAGCCAGETISSYGYTSIARQWWGAQITVYNRLPTIAGMTSCSTRWVQTGTQCTASATGGTTCSPYYSPVTSCSTTPAKPQRLISYKY